METPEPVCLKLVITGRVQGVGFRAFARESGRRHGLAGWVRNEPDGSVAALVSGPAAAVDAMIDTLRRGPPSSRVDSVSQTPAAPTDGTDFVILS